MRGLLLAASSAKSCSTKTTSTLMRRAKISTITSIRQYHQTNIFGRPTAVTFGNNNYNSRGSGVRGFSSSMAMDERVSSSDDGSFPPPPPSATPAPLVPLKHSRKLLPTACLDPYELQDLTEQVLATEVGNLFQFNRRTSATSTTTTTDTQTHREDAWNQADATLQMVEYLMRGHAATLPGTLWHKWTHKARLEHATTSSDTIDWQSLETLQALLDRMWDEGHFYMSVRKEHFSQVLWEQGGGLGGETNTNLPGETTTTNTSTMDGLVGTERDFTAHSVADLNGALDGINDTTNATEEDVDDDEGPRDLMEDFASPGPTVNMYDILLDAMAVAAIHSPEAPSDVTSQMMSPQDVFDRLQIILYRHRLDGGDELNTNSHTLPTQISFNATLRMVANLHYQYEEDSADGDEAFRDAALVAALGTYDLFNHTSLEKNPSTYQYMLQVMAKYLPPSRSRGHIAHGMFVRARQQGLVTHKVMMALTSAYEPSNGPEFDDWYNNTLKEGTKSKWRDQFPQRWRRRNQVSRHLLRQQIY